MFFDVPQFEVAFCGMSENDNSVTVFSVSLTGSRTVVPSVS
jgi:hypothetical protein